MMRRAADFVREFLVWLMLGFCGEVGVATVSKGAPPCQTAPCSDSSDAGVILPTAWKVRET